MKSLEFYGCWSWRVRPCARAVLMLSVLAGCACGATAQEAKGASAASTAANQAKDFDAAADKALAAMRRRADELKITGVAIVAYSEGERVEGWRSQMAVVGRLKDEPASGKGSNLLAIAYAKASEMADTLKDSGSGVRPPLTGEFGWSGGVIARGVRGYLIAAFSGGKSEDDVKVSQAGLEALRTKL